MPKRGKSPIHGDMLQGTLDLLVLKTLAIGPAHGHTIAYAIEHRSEDVMQGGIERAVLDLSRPASPRGPRVDFLLLGHVGKQPACPLLPAHAGGPQAADRTDQSLGRDCARREPDSEAGVRLDRGPERAAVRGRATLKGSPPHVGRAFQARRNI